LREDAAMSIFQRWNFIERCRDAVEGGDRQRSFQLEVWTFTLARIRRIERLMRDQQRPKG
jgi:hypothetical protein